MTTVISSNYAELSDIVSHYLEAGSGNDAVVLLHGVPQSSHCWRPIMAALSDRYRVIAPDLRGLGDTSRPKSGYDKKTVADDVWQLLRKLGVERFFLVGHDWGGPVAFSLAAQHPDAVRALCILDVTIPGDGAEMSQGGRRWHHPFFRTPDLPEALCAGRELMIVDWLFDNYGHRPDVISAADRAEYHRTYDSADAFLAMISFYRAFATDVADNEAIVAKNGKLKMPVLGFGGEKGFGRGMETVQSLKRMAENVTGGTIPDCGHWIAEEATDFLLAQLRAFFERNAAA
jgi:pimeloyl-ACP methyl ester carboxylesterase